MLSNDIKSTIDSTVYAVVGTEYYDYDYESLHDLVKEVADYLKDHVDNFDNQLFYTATFPIYTHIVNRVFEEMVDFAYDTAKNSGRMKEKEFYFLWAADGATLIADGLNYCYEQVLCDERMIVVNQKGYYTREQIKNKEIQTITHGFIFEHDDGVRFVEVYQLNS